MHRVLQNEIIDMVCAVQVTSLALCKVNKSEMFLRRLSQHFRHERTHDLFWKNEEVPQEALDILKVSQSTGDTGSSPALLICISLKKVPGWYDS